MARSGDWSVPRIWEGQTVAVLASGKSMSKAVADQVHGYGLPAIAVNKTWELAPWAQMLYAADSLWWEQNRVEFAGLKISVNDGGTLHKGVHRLKQTGYQGFDPDPSCIRTGGNSGYQAVHVAAHAGAKRILLCGFNMGGPHWHKEHRAPLRETGPGTYERWVNAFESLVRECPAEIINCTPESALRLRYVPLESFEPVERCAALSEVSV
jgi:hypothetical protein